MALTLSGTNGVVGAGFTLDPSGTSVTAGVGTFGSIKSDGIVQIGGATENSADIDATNSKVTIKQSGGSAEDGIYIERSGERRGHYIYVGGALSQSDALCVTTNQLGTDTDLLAIDRGGDVVIGAGNLVIGTAGKGIDFSATSDGSGTMSSELLDDYEEGTWTPVLTFGGGSTGITYANRGGNYTKIGRQVTLNFMVELSSKGSSTGDAVIGGLPYTIADLLSGTVIEASGSSSYWNNIEPDLMWLGWSASTSGNQLTPRYQPETGASDAVDSLSNSEFTNSTNFRGSITFFV